LAVRHTYWTVWKSVTTFDIRLGALDLADEVNAAITDAQARADVAFDRHDTALDSLEGEIVQRVTTKDLGSAEARIGSAELLLGSMDAPQIAYTVAVT